ncbi:MAG: hypothetical protein UT86_C0002G0024 [Candidatus Magasanikbacteria bacterium GW2011_GWC2_40_17]|uniref:Polysaccharide chain length determinant N-terminal domain-containing protein n=1 Tax=Candidatus Magasanikbacteria bacterium GW2011_GWA2_42_32 TaxID=1619039 RepID=A0A0G1A7D2_9BACT|nr:MAG: hypothetical protein UT86_C0002G0024 [Candidatus Magasanikbacteria bacterium GW2011_GWC2_40_17]KKS56859.1 MAG: hypothetical protein UV20_C0005G0024 [Candidatus Magasanikbacteria bacterium GW2011_GWA2_42_32]OGH85643.1 MAG: hypothetical protein A2294_00075 [Candidatus Magasanikbacteria bacterium RIFOXYB2_FULL_38_10]
MTYSALFLHYRLKIFWGAVLGLVIFLAASFFFTWQYSATARLLIIPGSSPGVDPYTAIKSAERINENLSQVVHTSSFYDRVVKTAPQFNFNPTEFNNLNEIKRRTAWDKAVITEVVSGTGFLNITVYNEDKNQAVSWANAISYALSTQGFEYISGNVQIKIVDAPVFSRFVTRPNFLLLGFLGIIIGGLVGAIYVLFKYE